MSAEYDPDASLPWSLPSYKQVRSAVLKVAFLHEVDDVFSTQEPQAKGHQKVKREPVLQDFLLYPHLTCSNPTGTGPGLGLGPKTVD